ncbi:hypothetical protein QZH41_016040 [Actinostola sp. cb2023]|nr:hypothetical protein QZH41_016040 [Actinostola sp. cb2023]
MAYLYIMMADAVSVRVGCLPTKTYHDEDVVMIKKRYKQDSLRSWMVLLTATLAEGLELCPSYCFSVILPVLVEEFKESRENVVLALVFYSPNVEDSDDDSDFSKESESQEDAAPSPINWRQSMRSFWNPLYAIGIIGIGLQSLGIYAPLSHMVKHANEIGYPAQKSSMLLIYIGVASLIGKVVAGRLCDSPKVSVFLVNQVAGFLITTAIMVLMFATDDKGFIAFAVLYGLGNGSFMVSMYLIWLNTVSPKYKSVGLACGEVVASIGVLTGSPFIGFLADRAGNYNVSLMVAAGIVLVASMIPFLRFCFMKSGVYEVEKVLKKQVEGDEEKIEKEIQEVKKIKETHEDKEKKEEV